MESGMITASIISKLFAQIAMLVYLLMVEEIYHVIVPDVQNG